MGNVLAKARGSFGRLMRCASCRKTIGLKFGEIHANKAHVS